MFKALAIVVAVGLLSSGCAGTLHYPKYADAKKEAYKEYMQTIRAVAGQLAEAMRSDKPEARAAGAMGIGFLLGGLKDFNLRMPVDQAVDVMRAFGVFAAPVMLVDMLGRHWAGQGATTINADGGSMVGLGGSSISYDSTSVTASGEMSQAGRIGADGNFTNYPQRDTGNTNN